MEDGSVLPNPSDGSNHAPVGQLLGLRLGRALAALALAGADGRAALGAAFAPPPSGSRTVWPCSLCSPACSLVSPSGESSSAAAMLVGALSSLAWASDGLLFFVALSTRKVTKPPTISITSTMGITYSMVMAYPRAFAP